MENLLVIKPVTVLLTDIMPKPKISTEQQKRIETIRRVVHTYNSAHLPVSQYFKRIAGSTKNHDEIFALCEVFHKTLVNDHKYTEMLAEAMCNVLSEDLCHLETIKFDAKLSLEAATKKIVSYEIKLSKRYELLAKILRRSEMLSRECLLTAFSLNPTWNIYMALTELHEKYSTTKHVQTVTGFSSILSAQTIESNGYDPTMNPVESILKGDKLATRLDKTNMWADLAAVIINPRIKTLQWTSSNWPELREQCQRFLNEPDHKTFMIRQNVAAMNETGQQLRYAQENNRVLARRLLHRTIKHLSYRKLKHERRKHVCVLDKSGGLAGFVKCEFS